MEPQLFLCPSRKSIYSPAGMLQILNDMMQVKVSIKLLIMLEKYKFAALEGMMAHFMCQFD